MDTPRGWQVGRSVLQCNSYMLSEKLACDVNIILNNNDKPIEFPAHKYVLVSRSPVFEAMLCGEFKEVSSTIMITDLEPDSFTQLLRFMYCEEAVITANNVLPILFAAKKYMVEGLVDKCVYFLKEHIAEDNVCTILNHCVMYEEHDLIQRCLKFIGPRAMDILKSDSFFELSKSALLHVVKHDRLIVDSECDTLNACKAWATQYIENKRLEEECDKQSCDNDISDVTDLEIRDVLGDCLYNIRFATMTVGQLAEAVGSSEILNDEETRILFCHISTWQYHKKLKQMKFNINPRCTTYDICRRFWQVSNGWSYDRGLSDAISFQVDRPIWLLGVSVYGGETPKDGHTYKLEIYNGTEHYWVSKSDGRLDTDGTDNPIPILLSVPQRLEPQAVHTIKLSMSGPKTYFGERGLRAVRCDGVKFTFTASSESMNDTVVAGGQIPELIFRRI